MENFKNNQIYFDQVYLEDIHNVRYYDQFINIYTDYICVFPKYIKYLTFSSEFDDDIEDEIPETVTHLTFLGYFKYSKGSIIPSSVTHLFFQRGFMYNHIRGLASGFNPKVANIIPSTVKYLEFGDEFNQDLKFMIIPNSVNIMKFGRHFNQNIKNLISSSVTQLTLPKKYNNKFAENVTYKINYV